MNKEIKNKENEISIDYPDGEEDFKEAYKDMNMVRKEDGSEDFRMIAKTQLKTNVSEDFRIGIAEGRKQTLEEVREKIKSIIRFINGDAPRDKSKLYVGAYELNVFIDELLEKLK